jgi:hypothetical protein
MTVLIVVGFVAILVFLEWNIARLTRRTVAESVPTRADIRERSRHAIDAPSRVATASARRPALGGTAVDAGPLPFSAQYDLIGDAEAIQRGDPDGPAPPHLACWPRVVLTCGHEVKLRRLRGGEFCEECQAWADVR